MSPHPIAQGVKMTQRSSVAQFAQGPPVGNSIAILSPSPFWARRQREHSSCQQFLPPLEKQGDVRCFFPANQLAQKFPRHRQHRLQTQLKELWNALGFSCLRHIYMNTCIQQVATGHMNVKTQTQTHTHTHIHTHKPMDSETTIDCQPA